MTTVTYADQAGVSAARYCFCVDCAPHAGHASAPPDNAFPEGSRTDDHILTVRDAADGQHPLMFGGNPNHMVITVSDRFLTGLVTQHGRNIGLTEVYDRAAAVLNEERHRASPYCPVIVELCNVPPALWREPRIAGPFGNA